MFRYVTFTWTVADESAAGTARMLARRLSASSNAWRCALDADGIKVFCADSRARSSIAYSVPNEGGVVLGKLFRRDSGVTEEIVLDTADADALRGTAGRHLIENYWGRYVAFLRDPRARTIWVLRDPVGALPCYHMSARGVRVFFSCADDCDCLDLPSPAINWRYVGVFLCYPEVQTHDTGLHGVAEIQSGECLELCADAATRTHLYWNPVRIARSDPIENVDRAIAKLREETRACISAWASCYPRVIHLLSGGLDSSIVLACLRSSPTQPAVQCLNYFVPGARVSDERIYARLAAEAAGCDLIESEELASNVDLRRCLDVAKSPKPWFSQSYVRHSEYEYSVCRDFKATAIFQGSGGDQVLYQGPLPDVAADYVFDHGIGRDLLRISWQTARAEQLSIWSVLKGAIRDGLLSPHWNPLSEIGRYRRFVHPDVVRQARLDSSLIHPWIVEREGLPRGKLQHILMCGISQDFYDPLGRADGPERVRPLVSQPLIEATLRVPTYILTTGGLDRAIARRAFASEVPSRILARTSKGMMDKLLHDLIASNLPFIREMLLDGLLVKEGLLDRPKMEASLARQSTNPDTSAADLVGMHIGTEAWARGWVQLDKRAAA